MNASNNSSSIVRFAAAALFAAAMSSEAALAAPRGELDPAFGNHGRLNLSRDLGLEVHVDRDHGRALAQQPADGKLLVGGSVFMALSESTAIAVARLNPDGSLDESFGEAGVAAVDASWEYATDLLLQPDGKIVVAGMANRGLNSDFAMARIDIDGTLDPTFGDAGRVRLNVAGAHDDYPARIVLSPDGKIVLVGATRRNGQFDVVFARFLANGALDTTFGTGPLAGTTIIDAGMSDEPASLIRQPDGKWVACGKSHVDDFGEYDGDMLAIRLNADGTVDAGFGASGIWRLENDARASAAGACALLPDGNLLLAGFVGPSVERAAALVRLRPDGALDTSFGIATLGLGENAQIQSMVVLDDGGLAVIGHAVPPYDGSAHAEDMFFARIDSDTGTLDPEFGQDGVTTVDARDAHLWGGASGTALIQQTDGKLTALGFAWHTENFWDPFASTVLARVDPDGGGSRGFVGFFDWIGVDEDAGPIAIRVRRTGGSTGNVSVDYQAVAGSATSPADFTAVSGTLTWMSGDMEAKLVTVPITDDSVDEAQETFRVLLTNGSGGLAWSDREVWIADSSAPTQNGPPGNGGGAGSGRPGSGGGALGLELLLLLASAAAVARRHPRR